MPGCLVDARDHRLPSLGRDERRARPARSPTACPPPARAAARSRSSPGRSSGEQFVYSELVVGTWGGRPVADGNDGLANPCASMANIPVELAESDWPIMIERYGLVTDSGGAGRYRGGLAVERVWRALVPGHGRPRPLRPPGAPALRPRGRRARAERSSSLLFRADGTLERMPPMFVRQLAARRRLPPPHARRRRLRRPVRARARGGRRGRARREDLRRRGAGALRRRRRPRRRGRRGRDGRSRREKVAT